MDYECIKQIINEPVKKLDIGEFNKFKEYLNKIDEKSNFIKSLIEFVKNELEKNDGEHNVIVAVDGGAEDAMGIKEFISLISDKEKEIFRYIYEKNEENKKDYHRSDEMDEYDAIKLLIDYFINKWNKKIENLKFMFLVSNLLPFLVERSYKIQLDEFIPKFDYVEVPEIEFNFSKFSPTDSTHNLSSTILTHNKFPSIRENLWGYEFPTFKYKDSIFDRLYKFITSPNTLYKIYVKLTIYYIRFEEEPQHYAIMCYVPLTGLCTYPKRHNNFSNILIAPDLNPFTKIALGIKFSEMFDPSNAIVKSTFFRAVVKYKWHTFARWRYYVVFLCYLINSCLFTVIVAINATNINNTKMINDATISTINVNRKLIVLSIILETFQTLFFFRWVIIILARRLLLDEAVFLLNVVSVFSVINGILEYKLLDLFLNFDVKEQFFVDDHVSRYLNILPYLRAVSVLIVWVGAFIFLTVFKNFGIFIMVIVSISKKAFRILSLLFSIIFMVTCALIFILIGVKPDDSENTFEGIGKLLESVWLASLSSSYDFLEPWDKNIFLKLYVFAFSIFTTIIVVNLLIAFVNDVYAKTIENVDIVWNLLRARHIAIGELACLSPSERNNENYFPLTIIYEANSDDVEIHNRNHNRNHK